MVSKGWLKERAIIKNMGLKPIVMQGEPMIYSIKYSLGERRFPVQFFRNKQWRSKLRCWFSAYIGVNTPVAVLACFYVSPQLTRKTHQLSEEDIASEKVPALHSWELADLEMSYLEMLKYALLDNYRQIVKIDVCKFYSKNPRTLIQILPWYHYVELQDNHPYQAKSEGLGSAWEGKSIQSERERNGSPGKLCEKGPLRSGRVSAVGTPAGDSALCISASEKMQPGKARIKRRKSALGKARRRQFRKVSERQLKQNTVD